MTYEELLQLIREQKDALTAEQWLAISACGLLGAVSATPKPRGKGGRPVGAKDKQPRKRRARHAPQE